MGRGVGLVPKGQVHRPSSQALGWAGLGRHCPPKGEFKAREETRGRGGQKMLGETGSGDQIQQVGSETGAMQTERGTGPTDVETG